MLLVSRMFLLGFSTKLLSLVLSVHVHTVQSQNPNGKTDQPPAPPANERACSTEFDCIPGKNLICIEGRCSCNKTESIFHKDLGTCVGKVGASCSKYFGKCLTNAYCPNDQYGYRYGRQINQYNSGPQCQCDVGFSDGPNGLCHGNIWTPCEPNMSPCGNGLICIGGICNCPYPEYQDYDRKSKQCVSQLYGPCDGNATCAPNTECRDNNGVQECLCKDGYIESEIKECRLNFGSKCDSPFGWNCDPVGGLICKAGTCACRELQIYDETKEKCRGLVGANCDISMEMEDFCVDGAFCKPLRDKTRSMGICRCNTGYSVEPESRICKM